MTATPEAAPEVRALCQALMAALGEPKSKAMLVSAEDAAAIVGVSRTSFYRMASRPEFPAPVRVVLGGRWWRRADLESFVSKLKNGSRPATATKC